MPSVDSIQESIACMRSSARALKGASERLKTHQYDSLISRCRRASRKLESLRSSIRKSERVHLEICRILGEALGIPTVRDGKQDSSDATSAGVVAGDCDAVSLALMVAKQLAYLRNACS